MKTTVYLAAGIVGLAALALPLTLHTSSAGQSIIPSSGGAGIAVDANFVYVFDGSRVIKLSKSNLAPVQQAMIPSLTFNGGGTIRHGGGQKR